MKVLWLPKAQAAGRFLLRLPGCPGSGMGGGCQPTSQPYELFKPEQLKQPRAVGAVYRYVAVGAQPLQPLTQR